MTTSGPAVAAVLPLAPHVRRRWRQRLGLAPDLVVDTTTLAPADVETALAVAAAAVVDAPHLRLALALGCPTVTDGATAAAHGAVDGDHVVVGERSDAEALADDLARAARLSYRGRALVEGADPPTLDGWTGHTQVSVQSSPANPAERVAAALDELGTAPSAPVRARAAATLEGFGPSVPGLAVTPSTRHPSIDPAAVVRLGGKDTAPSPSAASVGLRRWVGRARRVAARLLR